MPLRRWTRDTRLAFAMRNPVRWRKPMPESPAQTLRDPWPGNPATGERLVHNQTYFEGVTRKLHYGIWDDSSWPETYRRWLQSFEWLRDLRELGAESARIKARSLVSSWIHIPAAERQVSDPSVTGTRLTAWLSYYDFFAATADEPFREALIKALIMEGRSVIALMPEYAKGWHALTAMKGLLGVAIALPQFKEFLACYLKLSPHLITQQFLADGTHITRNPDHQLKAVKEIAEILSFHQTARLSIPPNLTAMTERAVAALRTMRHNDGGLMLFNGSSEHDSATIEHILNRASRSRIMASSLADGGYTRMASGRALLIADTATCAPSGHDKTAHAGMLSFEFASGRSRIIVNCGSSTQPGWNKALRQAAAHSVLEFPDISPVDIQKDGSIAHRPKITAAQASQSGASWLHMTHDGFESRGGGIFTRLLYLSADGQSLRGEDSLPGGTRTDFCVRFHLHPNVTVEKTSHGLLLHTDEESWLFQSDALATVEESVYLGTSQRQPTLQIVLTPSVPEKTQPEEKTEAVENREILVSDNTDLALTESDDTVPAFLNMAPVSPAPQVAAEQQVSIPEQEALLSFTENLVPETGEEDDYAPIPRDPPPADSIPTLFEGVTRLQYDHTRARNHAAASQTTLSRAEATAALHARRLEKERQITPQDTPLSAEFLARRGQQTQPVPCPPIKWALTLVSEP
ncbi:heparinase II/III family protein [Acetobacter thailandicus]|uniref:heparinase II/III family protein n=1 Tax=Acetobacter thailandicus TaxID=1502842 RepID=UPI001BA8B6F6|nr:heparinase II/III family protein [Acetobacter thailandicus]MBS0960006.1 heparinase II/III family protein [Acetobacter thailandicus]